jgi:hypothetical protein
VLLLRFQKAQMGEGLGVIGMSLQDGLPGGFGLGKLPLLFQGEGGIALPRRWACGLARTVTKGHGQDPGQDNP